MLGFSVSVSGIRVGLRRLDVSANNIANATTPGFKSSRVDAVDVKPGGAAVGSIRVNFNPGPIEIDDGGFSLAIEGDGFFRVQTPNGERYTRSGAFGFDADGNVVTGEGHILLPQITLPDDTVSVQVGADGVVSAVTQDGQVQQVGQIGLVRFANPGGLTHVGQSQEAASAASGPPIEGLPGEGSFGSLIFGALEGSNVDLASDLISQIVNSAVVKANIAALKTRNEIIGTVIDLRG